MHLWLPHPSPALWERLRGRSAGRPPRRPDGDRAAPPRCCAATRATSASCSCGSRRHDDVHHGDAERPATLLGRLQDDLREDRAPGPAPVDDTVRVHACHGPARQVEVLREVLLRLFAGRPDLEPRDVLVLCPDVETFAPLVPAAFGLGAGAAAPRPRAARAPGRPQPAAPPTRCSTPWPGCSRSPTAGSPRARCSTWPRAPRCGAGSGSTTTTSSGSATGWRAPACAGRSTCRAGAPYGMAEVPAEHLARRARPAAARGDDVRGRAGLARPRAPARRRRQQRHRPRRPAGRAARPARGRAVAAVRRAAGDGLGAGARRRPRRAHRGARGRRLAAGAGAPRARRGGRRRGRPGAARRRPGACSPTGCAAGRPAPASAPAR